MSNLFACWKKPFPDNISEEIEIRKVNTHPEMICKKYPERVLRPVKTIQEPSIDSIEEYVALLSGETPEETQERSIRNFKSVQWTERVTVNVGFNVLLIKQFLKYCKISKLLISNVSFRARALYTVQNASMKKGIVLDPSYKTILYALTKRLLLNRQYFRKYGLLPKDLYEECISDQATLLQNLGDGDRMDVMKMSMTFLSAYASNENMIYYPEDLVFDGDIPFIVQSKPNLVGDEKVTKVFSDEAIQPCGANKAAFFNHKHEPNFGDIYISRYIIIKELGRGRGSTVWLSWDISEKKFVAVKFIILQHLCQGDEVLYHKYIQEKEGCPRGSFTTLQDHFIICCEENILLGLVITPVGEDIKSKCAGSVDSPLNNRDTLCKAIQNILRGVKFVHSDCQLIHGDLKPRNFILTKSFAELQYIAKLECAFQIKQFSTRDMSDVDTYIEFLNASAVYKEILANRVNSKKQKFMPSVVIADFGLTVSANKVISRVIGFTKGYSSPESFWEKRADFKMDIWSLGCTFFEMATGKTKSNCLGTEEVMVESFLKRYPIDLDHGRIYDLLDLHRQIDFFERIMFELVIVKDWICEEGHDFASLIFDMIRPDPKERPTADDCLQNRWFDNRNKYFEKPQYFTYDETDTVINLIN